MTHEAHESLGAQTGPSHRHHLIGRMQLRQAEGRFVARCNRLASCGQAIWLPKLGSINGSIWIHLDDGDLNPHSQSIGKPSSKWWIGIFGSTFIT